MRTSVFLSSALAMGVLARPQPHRREGPIVTETEVIVETVVVYVTAGYAEPTSTSLHTSAMTSLQAESTDATSTASLPSFTPVPEDTLVPTSNPEVEPQPEPTSFELASTSSLAPAPLEFQPQEQEREWRPWWFRPTPSPSPTPIPSPPAPIRSSAAPAAALPALSGDHPTGTAEAYLSSGAQYQAAVLYHHNAARANHGAQPLTWDASCEANAHIAAQTCNFQHYIPQGAGQGQNLFTVSGDAFNVTAGITESWYKSELGPMMPYFGQNSIPDDVFHSIGHLTQLVWKGTTKVGCVSIDCGSNMVVGGAASSLNKYTVCNYAPAGNIAGRYAANVAAPISLTNLGSWSD